MNCDKLCTRVKQLEEQNAIQAKQINWCAEMIFALVGSRTK